MMKRRGNGSKLKRDERASYRKRNTLMKEGNIVEMKGKEGKKNRKEKLKRKRKRNRKRKQGQIKRRLLLIRGLVGEKKKKIGRNEINKLSK